jgi:hypothetical protein
MSEHAVKETTLSTRWPTIAANPAGRLVGRLCGMTFGWSRVFTLGTFWAVATIPISFAVFAWQLMPFVCRRYRLTNRRIVIEKGISAVENRAIGLDEFDAIDVDILPGQEWLHAGELIFRRQGTEAFRLSGVSRPEPFRESCLKAQTALVSVRDVLQRQAARHAASTHSS